MRTSHHRTGLIITWEDNRQQHEAFHDDPDEVIIGIINKARYAAHLLLLTLADRWPTVGIHLFIFLRPAFHAFRSLTCIDQEVNADDQLDSYETKSKS